MKPLPMCSGCKWSKGSDSSWFCVVNELETCTIKAAKKAKEQQEPCHCTLRDLLLNGCTCGGK